jgi:cell division initiation protein
VSAPAHDGVVRLPAPALDGRGLTADSPVGNFAFHRGRDRIRGPMRLTPLDIQQKSFRPKLRGVDLEEVESFLKLVAAEFEELVKENLRLQDELKRRSARLDEYRDREKTLQETMITAQRITEDMKEQARKEGELRMAEAELQADKIVQGAQERLSGLVKEIQELKRQRMQYLEGLHNLIESHRKLLETMEAEPEDKVSFLAKK